MDELDDVLKQIKTEGTNLNLHTIDEIIPVDVQMKYFQFSKHVQQEQNKFDRDYLIAKLFSPDVDQDDKKYYMCLLANFVDVIAYRALEIYRRSPLESELTDWCAMALIESRMLLEKDLSGEKQIFVSTGLGGKSGLLRFFCIITSSKRTDFSDFEKEILNREILFYFQKNKIEIEEIFVQKNYMKILFLSNINNDIKFVINEAINESNIFGDFVDKRFVLTNIQKFSDQEIEKMLQNESEKE